MALSVLKGETTWEKIEKDLDAAEINNEDEYILPNGELLDKHENGNVLVVKAKVESCLTKKLTISQNGFNVEELIKGQGADSYNEIQYWAVADMENGEEEKIISFTVDKDLIDKVKEGKIVGNQIIDNAKDVYILPGLK